MTEEHEASTQVAAKLLGEFYVGQRVKLSGCSGTITELFGPWYVVVRLDLGRTMTVLRSQVDLI